MQITKSSSHRLSPEEEELAKKREELALLQLADRELYLTNLRSERSAFEGRYLRTVGVLYAELDEWNAKIAELVETDEATEEARSAAAQARTQADESRSAVDGAAAKARGFTASPELKSCTEIEVSVRVASSEALNCQSVGVWRYPVVSDVEPLVTLVSTPPSRISVRKQVCTSDSGMPVCQQAAHSRLFTNPNPCGPSRLPEARDKLVLVHLKHIGFTDFRRINLSGSCAHCHSGCHVAGTGLSINKRKQGLHARARCKHDFVYGISALRRRIEIDCAESTLHFKQRPR